LLAVPSVEGGFLVGKDGEVEASCMPADPALLKEVGAKVGRLRRAFLLASERLDFCAAEFGRYKLCLSVGAAGMLCILARADANLATVRVAATALLGQLRG
jgi:hypothetical protein